MNNLVNNSGNVLASMWMSSTFLGDLITLNSLEEIARRLCEELRELTGAKTVAFLQHTDSQAPCKPLYVCPPRRMALFEDGNLSTLCPICHPDPIPVNLAELSPDDPPSEQLKETPFENLLRIPIQSGTQLMGSFIIADLPDPEHHSEILSIMEFVGPTIGLTIQNCIDRKHLQQQRDTLEAQVETRTAEIREANKELNTARMAALNMMEDAILAKDRLEMSQFALDKAADSIFWINQAGSFFYVNESACERLGYTRDELLNLSVHDIDPEFPAERWPSHWQDLMQQKGLRFESIHQTKTGKTFPVELVVGAIQFHEKEYVCAFAHDITEQKRQEDALRASEEMMRHSQSVAHICSYSTNLNENELEKSQWVCSPEFYNIFGIDETYPHTMEGWASFIHPDFRDEMVAYHESVVKEKTSFNKEYKIIRIDDGAERWVHGTGELEFDRTGTPIRMHGAIQDITERKQARTALEESRYLLRTIIDTMPGRVWWKDRDSRFLGCNIHLAHDAGFDHPEQLIGKTDYDFCWKDLADRYLADEHEVLESGKPKLGIEELHRQADGSVHLIETNKIPLRSPDGEIIGTMGTYTDITERKQAQQALEESRQLLSDIIDTLPERVWWKDLDSRYLGCNIHVAQDAGFDHPDQMIGKTDFDMIWAGEAERFIANDRSVIESGMPRLTDDRMQVLEGGRIRWINVSQFPLKDTNGKIIGTLSTYADVTERKQAQQAVEESRQLLCNIINTIPERVWWKDLDSRYMGCNILVAQDAGFDHPDQLIGKTDFDMPWADRAETFIANDRAIIESGMPSLNDPERQVAEDGSIRWIDVSVIPLRDTTGKIFGVMGTYADITERMLMQEAIEKQILALTRPLEGGADITFEELFNLKDIQRIQDEFSNATGTASLILRPDGTPITQPSNFVDLCKLIRATEKGCANCLKSDQTIGAYHPDGPLIRPCMSGGLWDAGSNIIVGGKHVASWLIGQVRDETQTEDQVRAYAREIGVDEAVLIKAFRKVPSMPRQQFEKVAQALSTLANQLSTSAYQNMQQARFISDQKKTEQSLRESEARFKSLHDASFGGIAIHDNGIILECNHGLSILSGYSEEELIGMNGVTGLIAEDSRDLVMSKIQTDNEKPYEVTGLRKNGETYPVRLEARNVLYKGNRARTVEFRDITESKKAEEELRRLSTAIDQSPETVVITDIEGTIQYVNPAFTTITGYTREEAIGQNPRILKSGAHDEAFYADMWRQLLAGEIWEGRLVNKRKNGSLFTEEASLAPVKNRNGKITNFVGVKRDITNELLQEEQMKQVQKMEAVGQLAGGIAHDFNNILQAILGFSELLLMTLDEHAEQPRNNVHEIQKAAQHAADLTRQLLAFSRKETTEFESLNLNDAIRSSLSFAHSIIGENIEIKTHLEPNLNPVKADSRQVERTILNMALNARDAMPEGGVLTLKTENIRFTAEDTSTFAEIQEGEFICLIISDTGTGIPPDIITHIFEPFFTTKPTGQGTGLGLAAIYGMIKEHNGWINVYSEPGRGTTFKIYLPADQYDSPHEETISPLHKISGGERVLLVEDDAAYQALSQNALQKAGYLVMVTSTAEEAEALFDKENGQFDLLFADVVLPDKKGNDLAASLLEKNPDLKVLLCSGYPADCIKTSTLNRKNLFFLEKPFSIVTLLKLVNQMFTRQP